MDGVGDISTDYQKQNTGWPRNRGRRKDPDVSMPAHERAGTVIDGREAATVAARAADVNFVIARMTELAAVMGLRYLMHPRGRIYINPRTGKAACLTDFGTVVPAKVSVARAAKAEAADVTVGEKA